MPALAWSDFDALPDVLATDRFQFLLSPSGVAGINQVLAIRCMQVSIPEEMFDVMPVNIQGMEFNFRGRRTYDKAISASFVETTDQVVSRSIAQWMQLIAGSESQNGPGKTGYVTQGTLNVFDQSGNVALSYTIDNIWPSSVPAVQLEGSQAQPLVKQVTFTYDRFHLSTVSNQ